MLQQKVNETISNAWLKGHLVGLAGLALSFFLVFKFSWDSFIYIGPAFYIAIVAFMIIKKGREIDKENPANSMDSKNVD